MIDVDPTWCVCAEPCRTLRVSRESARRTIAGRPCGRTTLASALALALSTATTTATTATTLTSLPAFAAFCGRIAVARITRCALLQVNAIRSIAITRAFAHRAIAYIIGGIFAIIAIAIVHGLAH